MVSDVNIKTRKFLKNALLGRKQFVIEVVHPGKGGVKREELAKKLAATYKVSEQCISLFGFKTHFGGGRTTGFGLVYDSIDKAKKFEPKYRQKRVGIEVKSGVARRGKKEIKNRAKKFFAKDKKKAVGAGK